MKRIFSIIMLLGLCVTLFGCGGNADDEVANLVSDFQDNFETKPLPKTVLENMNYLINNFTGGVTPPSGVVKKQPPTTTPNTTVPSQTTNNNSQTVSQQTTTNPNVVVTTAPSVTKKGKNNVCNNLKSAKKQIAQNLKSVNPKFNIIIKKNKDYSRNLLDYMTEDFDADYPIESMFLEQSAITPPYKKGKNLVYEIEVKYQKPISTVKQCINKTKKKINVVNTQLNLNGLSEYKKIRSINTFLCDNTDYPKKSSDSNNPYKASAYTVYGVLIKGSAVCEGYAKTVKALCDMNGIKAYYVPGNTNGGPHAWNLVRVDKKWYQLDVTWNDQAPKRTDYFLVTDEFMSYSRAWDKSKYPKSARTKYRP